MQLFSFLLPEHNHTRDWCLPTVPEDEGTLVEKRGLISLEITWGLTVTKLIPNNRISVELGLITEFLSNFFVQLLSRNCVFFSNMVSLVGLAEQYPLSTSTTVKFQSEFCLRSWSSLGVLIGMLCWTAPTCKEQRWRIVSVTGHPCVSQFSLSDTSNYLRRHGLQHTRLLCPSPTPGACSDSWPSSW